MAAKLDGIGVFDLYRTVFDAVEALHHLERLFVAHNLDVGVVLLDQRDGTAVVGLHVVDDQIVDGAVADDLVNVLDELREEIDLHGVNETNLLIINEIRVVAYAIGQRPQSFEEMLVAVVDAHVVDVACNFLHSLISFNDYSADCASSRRSSSFICAPNSTETELLMLLQHSFE